VRDGSFVNNITIKNKLMKSINQILKISLTLLIIGVVVVSCDSKAETQKPASPRIETNPALPVDIIVVHGAFLLQEEMIAGSMSASKEVIIASEIAKKVSYVAFKDGSYVTKGQLLYKLDDADIRARIRQLQAELRLARTNEQRMASLLKTETVRQAEYDESLTRLQSLEAEQDGLFVALSKTEIRAPFSGVIGITKVHAGAFVTPGAPMVVLQDHGSVKLDFSVSEKYLPLVKLGDKVKFTTEVSKDTFSALITATEPGIESQNRSFPLQAVASNTARLFKPGMSAKILFNATPNTRGISVPTEALIPNGNGYSVFVVKNGAASITPVSISNRNENEAIITKGLNDGDSVMVSNILRAADGMRVQVFTSK
jgi:membrane fusion protein, multidrug efflux system